MFENGLKKKDVPEIRNLYIPSSSDKPTQVDGIRDLIRYEAKKAGYSDADKFVQDVFGGHSDFERYLKDIASGPLSVLEGIFSFAGGGLNSKSFKEASHRVQQMRKDLAPLDPNLKDSAFQMGGELATYFIPGFGVTKAMRSSAVTNKAISTLAGSATSGVLESSAYAGRVYDELIENGFTHKEALSRADKIFSTNVALITLSNKFGIFSGGNVLPRVLKSAGFESAQSGFSTASYNHFTDKKLFQGVPTSTLLGGLTGGALKGLTSIRVLNQLEGAKMIFGLEDTVSGLKFLDSDSFLNRNYKALSARLGLTKEQMDAFRPKNKKDSLTGFGVSEDRIPTVKRARIYAAVSGKEALYGEIDISNLGGMNEAAGRGKANEVFKKISEILEDEVQKEVKKGRGTAEWFRHGGDEISVVTTGISKKNLDSAMKRAEEKVRKYVESVKLDNGTFLKDIPHPKDPRNPDKNGVGITFESARLDEVISIEDSLSYADTLIELKKQNKISKDAVQDKKRPEVPKNNFRTPSKEAVRNSKEKERRYIDSLPDEIRNSDKFLEPKEVLEKCHNAKAEREGLTEAQRKALAPPIQKDPVLGSYTNYDRVKSLARLIDFSGRSNTPSFVIGYEIRNLSGLNKVFGATIANSHMKRIVSGLEKELKKELGNKAVVLNFRNKGVRGEFQIAGASKKEIEEILVKYDDFLKQYTKAEGLANISHPKDSHPSQNGVGMYLGVSEVDGSSSVVGVYSKVNKLIKDEEIKQMSKGR